MPAGFLDRQRARQLMAEQGLDALVLAQPETLSYATGAFAGVATLWRRAGAAFVVVPGDPDAALTAIVGDLQAGEFQRQTGIADVRAHPIWVETGDYRADLSDHADAVLRTRDLQLGRLERSPRPAQFDIDICLGLVRDCLAERRLLGGRIGLELGFVAARDFPHFQRLLPRATFADATRLVEQLRAIKSAEEIQRLRRGAVYAAAGFSALIDQITPGMDATHMSTVWRAAALAEAARHGHPPPGSTWAYIAVGGDGFAPGGPAAPGDLIKIDVGCVVGGYSSDGARTAVLGQASRPQRQVYDALHRAFDAGLALLAPGIALAEVYRAVSHAMWEAGFTTYNRGHFGHGVGASIWSEEWPFIAADATATAEPGMVLAFETPYYIKGLGGFIIEDQVLVTDNGIEVMAPLPRELVRIAV